MVVALTTSVTSLEKPPFPTESGTLSSGVRPTEYATSATFCNRVSRRLVSGLTTTTRSWAPVEVLCDLSTGEDPPAWCSCARWEVRATPRLAASTIAEQSRATVVLHPVRFMPPCGRVTTPSHRTWEPCL